MRTLLYAALAFASPLAFAQAPAGPRRATWSWWATRPAGAQRLPAADPPAGRALDRLHRPPRRHSSSNPLTGPARGQRHVDRRRHRPAASEATSRTSPASRRLGRSRRRADGARVRRRDAAAAPTKARSTCCAPSATPAHEIWDVTDPGEARARHGDRERPAATRTRAGGNATPASPTSSPAPPGWRTRRMTQIYDLSRPGAAASSSATSACPASSPARTGAAPTELHGPISTGPKGNRVYFGYGTNKRRHDADRRPREALQRSDGADRRQPALSAGGAARLCRRTHGAHTAFPLLRRWTSPSSRNATRRGARKRDFVVIVDESLANECLEARQMVWIVDITAEPRPFGVVELDRARGERQFLRARRPLRHAFVEREHDADLLRARGVHRVLQRRRARARHPRPVTTRRRSATTSRR